ncbi:hypothetical protein KY290_027018 [Solanum tuberosum]|uniref:Ycf2 N-terminal domain-containing protein n=1 Tax=Solanum tuberosum TaxID=4113 RepID=A0ABQ7UFH2_SOLTU|nr:hypothetical protein KY284_025980 [Solanum tuberosum]KAH0747786.1 hypothetical protein KY290_027018 [Solanum tuberosum]
MEETVKFWFLCCFSTCWECVSKRIAAFAIDTDRKNLQRYFNWNMGLIHTPCLKKDVSSEKRKQRSLCLKK